MDKANRAMARELNRAKNLQRRRNLGRKKQTTDEAVSLREFQKRFPQLPIKTWYAQRRHLGQGYYDY